jgi:cytochrome bd ubiquinol oxidase subunit II
MRCSAGPTSAPDSGTSWRAATWPRRSFGAAFAASSVITPFFLGAAAGAVGSGHVPPGIGTGQPVGSWWNPVSVMTGILAVAVCAYLAAVDLTGDARRDGDATLVAQFRLRALAAGVAAGAVAASGLLFLHQDAAILYHGLTHRGLPLVVISAVAGILSLLLLYRRQFLTARLTAALAVTAVLWAWAAAQYPNLLTPGLMISGAAAQRGGPHRHPRQPQRRRSASHPVPDMALHPVSAARDRRLVADPVRPASGSG